MNRHYYICDDLDVLEVLQEDLQTRGIDSLRVHVLSEQDAQLSAHHLNEVESLAKKDMVRSGLKGAMIGLVLAMLILLLALLAGLMATVWAVPILFLAVVILGFCTWEGGLIGVHRPNPEVSKFKEQLENGQHVLLIDIEDNEQAALDRALAKHPEIKQAGIGKSGSSLVWHLRQSLRNLIRSLP